MFDKRYKHPIIGKRAYRWVKQIMDSGELSMFRGTPEGHDGGKFVQKLEAEFRAYFGIKHAIAVQSATAGLHMSVIAGGKHRWTVSPYTFASSVTCVLMNYARPIFSDIDDKTFGINGACIFTGGVIPVHLCGNPLDYDKLSIEREHFVIEDAAQALGAVYKNQLVGTLGDVGVFSFNQSKNVSCGEGGMVITNNDDIARKIKALRNHGEVSDPELGIFGYNYRMTEIEAAIALEQFQRLGQINNHRIALCNYMTDELSKIYGLTPPYVIPGCKHVYYTYALKIDQNKIGMTKHEFSQKLREHGVYFGDYVKPLHLLPIFGGHEGQCPVAERLWKSELIVTDIFRPPMQLKEAKKIVATIRKVLML